MLPRKPLLFLCATAFVAGSIALGAMPARAQSSQPCVTANQDTRLYPEGCRWFSCSVPVAKDRAFRVVDEDDKGSLFVRHLTARGWVGSADFDTDPSGLACRHAGI